MGLGKEGNCKKQATAVQPWAWQYLSVKGTIPWREHLGGLQHHVTVALPLQGLVVRNVLRLMGAVLQATQPLPRSIMLQMIVIYKLQGFNKENSCHLVVSRVTGEGTKE
ncbi:hypothetical protein E2C01_041172 [Portunus trituberculatus]|uniref:Uncharacterized protein n=1 Tax=Portunus trituberculatus TaxID=210409 RepID=A0A5B7FPZ8_PORTR|nr:hypothetical protein [Portunus trituberculatus]